MLNELPTFDIRNFLDRLTPKKGKNRYNCPCCDGSLTVDPSNGKYHCWGEECRNEDIREAIRPLSEALREAGIVQSNYTPKPKAQKPKVEPPKPAPIPDGEIVLGTLPNPGKEQPRIKINGRAEAQIKYPYSQKQWMLRVEKPGQPKQCYPYHIDHQGKICKGKGDLDWLPYRFTEVKAYGQGKWVLGVEGEKSTDVARSVFGFVAFTLQSYTWSQADRYFQMFKDAGIAGIIYWVDNDIPGRNKLEKLKLAAAKVGLPFIAIDPVRLWPDCPDGGDIADWVKAGYGVDEIDAVYEEINQAANDAKGIKPDWKDKVAKVQKKLHTLTYKPDILVTGNDKYLPKDLIHQIPTKGVCLLKGPKGSGKSVTINNLKKLRCGGYWEEKILTSQLSLTEENKPVVEQVYREKTGVKFISITARIALGRGQAIEWDITWIEDGDLSEKETYNYEGELIQTATFLETADGIGLCWDSLAKLFDRDWSNSIVVIDEIELGFSHVATSSTCKDRRSKILATLETKLKECLDGGGLVIGADADLTDISYEYLSAICPGHKPFIIKKEYDRPDADKWDISFYSGKKDIVLSQIENWLSDENCDPIAVAVDNQKEAEALASHLLKTYPWLSSSFNGLIRIDSRITQTDFGKDFVKRANEKIKEYQPKVLIYTPSLGVGCSLDIPYFKYVFGLMFGNLEPSQARQMLARVRQPVPRIVWAADRGQGVSSDDFNAFMPDAIKHQIFSYNDLTTQVIDIALYLAKQQTESQNDAEILPKLIENLQAMMGKNGTWNSPHIDLFCKLKARRNFALSQFGLQLRQELIDEGHNLKDYAADEKTNTGDKVKEEKEEIKLNHALRTSQAEDIELDKAKEINRKPNPTDEEKYQASKAFLKDELPEVNLTPEFLFKAVYKDDRRWLNAIKLFWMVNNVEATKEADRKHWKYKLKQFMDGVSYLPDVRTYSGKVEAINKIKLFDIIRLDNFEIEYSNNNEDLKTWFKKSILPHKKLLKNAFNITVHKGTEIIPFINKLLNRLGLKLKQSRKTDDIRFYCLDTELALDEDRLNVLKALDLKRELQLKAEAEAAEAKACEIVSSQESPIINDQSPMTNDQLPMTNDQLLVTSYQAQITQTWKGLMVKIRDGIATGEKLYQDLISKFKGMGKPENEPFQNEYDNNQWWIKVQFSTGCRSIPCAWLEAVSC